MIFNAPFNNVSVISWRSVLLVEEIVKLYHTMLYRVPYDDDCQTWPHNVVPSTIWTRLSNFTTQFCTEYHMITIVKLDHTMLYRVPYDNDCQTWPHNPVPSTIWSITIVKLDHIMLYRGTICWRLSNLTTQCCTKYHMITIVKLEHTMLYRGTIWWRLSNLTT
jgi:hypothetical protein